MACGLSAAGAFMIGDIIGVDSSWSQSILLFDGVRWNGKGYLSRDPPLARRGIPGSWYIGITFEGVFGSN